MIFIKNIFIKLSKIITYICIAEIVLMIIFLILFGSNDDITIPTAVGLIFLGILFLTMICLLIAFVLGFIEGIRKRNKRYFIELAVMVAVIVAARIIGNLISEEPEGIIPVIIGSLAIVFAINAGKYIFSK